MKTLDLSRPWRALPFGIGMLSLLLFALFLGLRGVSMLGPAMMRPLFLLMCVAMIALPWLLLTPHGRYQIGLKRPSRPIWLLVALGVGPLFAGLCFIVGVQLFGSSADNWFVSVARTYREQPSAGLSMLQLHLMFTIVACTFSPLGEEFFFRGYLQKILEQRMSVRAATHAQSAAFSLVHLFHHGIIMGAAGLVLRPLSGALWVLLLWSLSLALSWLRRESDSVFPAVAGHAAFNATMNACIFAYLWST